MNRPDGRIEKGQRLTSAISARAWNRAQDAADIVLGVTPGTVAGDGIPIEKASNIVLVRNNSGQPVPWLGVLEFNGIVIDPGNGTLEGQNANSDKARELVRRPVLVGVLPDGTRPFGVALEPIPVNGIGRVAVGGTFTCKIKILAQTHGYARSRKNDVTQLISAECGPMRLVWKQANGNDKFGVVVA